MTKRVMANRLTIGKIKRNFCPICSSFKCFLKYFKAILIPKIGSRNMLIKTTELITVVIVLDKIALQGNAINTIGDSIKSKFKINMVVSDVLNFMYSRFGRKR
jgi:hypothetical protein